MQIKFKGESVAYPDLQIRARGGGGGHPDPGDKGERAPPLDPPLGIGKRRQVPTTILEKLELMFLTLPNLL